MQIKWKKLQRIFMIFAGNWKKSKDLFVFDADFGGKLRICE